ncbi:vitellogenin isoform X1 [Plutella xylostella]|uniref:vitellogenin isoform X1 n=1 Tax=Plutella xylostella TaxID=51655 RepID=UPI0020325B2C|nr:vitellogenin isoform X1 [Plutella xylostella]
MSVHDSKRSLLTTHISPAVAATTGRPSHDVTSETTAWPWQDGKLYEYEVTSHTLATLPEGASAGAALRASLQLRARAGRLLARLLLPRHARVHQPLPARSLPADLDYKPYTYLDQPFEISVVGGRVVALNVPATLSAANQNLLKGLISALQVDLTPYRTVRDSHSFFNKETFQGQFYKKEIDVTGDCETLYTVAPLAAEWRRELPAFADHDEPVEITKSKDYGKCHHQVAFNFGIPASAVWSGVALNPQSTQLIKRHTESRIIAGKQGPIYQAQVTSTVHASPLMYGQQKAEVYSVVKLSLLSIKQDDQEEWKLSEKMRAIKNLLYTVSADGVHIDENSSEESTEQIDSIRRRRASHESDEMLDMWSSQETNDDIANIEHPAYMPMYMVQGKENKNAPATVQKLVQEIAQQLQNPNNMPKADTLTKFNIVVRLIAGMSQEQLALTSRSIEAAKASDIIIKNDMWMVYRDAVTQAGSMPAFHQIQTWIKTKKLQGEEAAQVVATLPKTLQYPTKDLMIQFFNMAMCEEVMKQPYLNSTALIAAARFINQGQVNNLTAISYYPTYMYGRLARRHDSFVVDMILPRLSEDLKQAIERGDSHRAQVVIKAIGNLGHRAILDVFTPYLQGQVVVSTFLRRLMVDNLYQLASERDHAVRAVLYSILRNSAEPYEVRLSALQSIFAAQPTVAMMQAMARMTLDDPSVQVRAALKAIILSAAKLKDHRFRDLAKMADSVKEIVTKEKFDIVYSQKQMIDFFSQDQDLGFLAVLSSIGSEDSLAPQYLRYSWWNKVHGWGNKNTIAASMSNVRQFIEYFSEQMNIQKKQEYKTSDFKAKFSAEKIAEMLQIKRDPEQPLEAAFDIEIMNHQRFLVFSEADMQQLPREFARGIERLAQGVDFHYTKMLSPARATVMFPVAMGVPFIYQYKEPTLLHVQGKAKASVTFPGKESKDFATTIDKEIQITFARNIDGSVGFFDTLSNQYSSAGVVSKIQFNIPIKAQIKIEAGKLKFNLEPLNPDMDTTVAHFSVWPYTASQAKDSHVPAALDPTTKVITRSEKVTTVDTKFGLVSTGIQFQAQGYSYSKDFRNFGSMMKGNDFMSNIIFAAYQKDVALTHYNFKFLGKQSVNKRVSITAVYGKYYNQKSSVDVLKPTDISDVSPDSAARRELLVQRVAAGVTPARVQLLDLSASFLGAQPADYVLTAAAAQSSVDPKIQYALFAARTHAKLGNSQLNAVGTFMKPEITSMNFPEVLKQEIKTDFNADIKFGTSGKIQVIGFLERTKKYTEILKNLPRSKQCMSEIAEKNYYQPACHQMIKMANSPDFLSASVTYKDVSPSVKNMTYQLYRLARHAGFWYTEENTLRSTVDGKLEVTLDMSYVQNRFELAVASRAGDLRVRSGYLPDVALSAAAIYSPMYTSMVDRVVNYYTGHQYMPYCAVEDNKIKTFSNRSYSYSMGAAWHVVALDDASYAGRRQHDPRQLVLLARRPVPQHQEIYIFYRTEPGKEMEIEVKPAPEGSNKKGIVKITTNLKMISEGELTMYWDEETKMPLLKYYTLADGSMVFSIEQGRARVIYDGQRLVVLRKENRGNSRGVCGYMSGDARDDYLTPAGIVDAPEHYGASYALREHATPALLELQQQAAKLAYQPAQHYTAILAADAEWSQSVQREHVWQHAYRARYYGASAECRVQQQVQYYEHHGDTCVSTRQVAACAAQCRGDGYEVQPAEVVCGPRGDKVFHSYVEQIRAGGNPQVSGVTKIQQFRVPKRCLA